LDEEVTKLKLKRHLIKKQVLVNYTCLWSRRFFITAGAATAAAGAVGTAGTEAGANGASGSGAAGGEMDAAALWGSAAGAGTPEVADTPETGTAAPTL